MMICNECGAVFDEPVITGRVQPVYSVLAVTDPEIRACPLCSSEDICDARVCPVCGGLTSSVPVCPSCKSSLDALAARAHKKADELYFDLICEYSHGNAAALSYMECLF